MHSKAEKEKGNLKKKKKKGQKARQEEKIIKWK